MRHASICLVIALCGPLFACSDTSETEAPQQSGPGGDGGAASDGGDGGAASDGGSGGGDGGADADDCPDGMVCVTTFPYVESNDTRDSALRDFDSYACAPDTDEGGPEIVYRVDLAHDGYLAVELDDWDQDVDVHILGSLDSDDCIDRGHVNAGSLLPAGRYYVVVDSWMSDGEEYAGRYDISLGHTSAAAFEADGLRQEVLELGLYAFDVAWMGDEVDRFLFTIIDFSLPSTDKRQWTMDLVSGDLLWNVYVSHGEGSGDDADPRYADAFSNEDGSHMSSLGLMRTDSTYDGSNGYSLRLDGLESGINDNARDRAIVVHGASYAGQDFIDDYGYLGRSWGCPAVDDDVSDALIDDVSDGTLYWSYYPDAGFLRDSRYLP